MIASIIITTLNRPELVLKRSLPSAERQTFKGKYEIILVDDGSTMSYNKVLEHMKGSTVPFKYIELDVNRGLSYARNRGVREAQGTYIVCLDDDNELLPDFLKETIATIGNADAVSVGRIIKYPEKGYQDYAPPYKKDEKFISLDWGWLIRKSVFDVIRYDEDMRANEDADFGIQFTKRFSYTSLNSPLAVAYDQEGDPKLSMSYPSERILHGIRYYLDKNLHEYKNYPNELRYIYRLAGRRFYLGGYKKEGIKYFWLSFRAMPNWKTFKHLFFILLGWKAYDWYMTFYEKREANKKL